ncbi:MAG TPA: hypothetical protein VFM90_12930, partial [Cyclobacteriaceae bacterium]|nr:hypothetical protein [Cyclobacteriaceae bacterium]
HSTNAVLTPSPCMFSKAVSEHTLIFKGFKISKGLRCGIVRSVDVQSYAAKNLLCVTRMLTNAKVSLS